MSGQVALSDAPEQSRFEAHVDGGLAGFVDYQAAGEVLVLKHTEVLPGHEGQGVGGALARYSLEQTRARGLRAVVVCPFILAWVRKHPDHAPELYNAAPRPDADGASS